MVLLAGTPWTPGAGLDALRMHKVGRSLDLLAHYLTDPAP
jgi:hypothetical protein